MSLETSRGRFVWFDLSTTDVTGAIAFYRDVIGWGTEQWDGGGMPYTMWTNGGAPIGGVMPLPDELRSAGVPSNWMPHIVTPDVDAAVAQATTLGGSVIEAPIEIPTVGRMAVLRDPWGATFSAFTPAAEPPGHEGMPNVGEFSWFELATHDHAAALAFYGALFGWEAGTLMDMGPNGKYQIFNRNGAMLGGIYDIQPSMPMHMPPSWTCYVRVAGLDAAVGRVRANGGRVMIDPMEIPGGDRIAICSDAQGAVFAMHEVKQPS